jgi:hypothetical protein
MSRGKPFEFALVGALSYSRFAGKTGEGRLNLSSGLVDAKLAGVFVLAPMTSQGLARKPHDRVIPLRNDPSGSEAERHGSRGSRPREIRC